MSLRFLPEITDGVLLARRGDVHQAYSTRHTTCGLFIPAQVPTVSHVQATVHKLRLCPTCFPLHHANAGRYGRKPCLSPAC